MHINFVPLVVFVVVTIFTPGPGNVATAAMGMLHGYRRTLGFMVGMVLGSQLILGLSAFVSKELLEALPILEPVLRVLGVGYLLWLTVGAARATYHFGDDRLEPMAFRHGFLLQALNPKASIFGITLYTTFLSSISAEPEALWLSLAVLAVITFASVSLWTYAGARIGSYLHIPRVRQTVNCVLVMLLLYCAVSLSGVLDILT